jgi:hypothetical protein
MIGDALIEQKISASAAKGDLTARERGLTDFL